MDPKLKLLAIAFGTILLIAPALAQDRPPPKNAMPLSQILQSLEKQDQLVHFADIEWEDEGYWEIKYATKDGKIVKVRIDPVSGQPKK